MPKGKASIHIGKLENHDNGVVNIADEITSTIINTQGGDVAMRDSFRIQQFRTILETVDQKQNLANAEKEDLKSDILDVQAEASKGDKADEGFLARRLRNIKRMAPDILDVVTGTLVNPIAGFGVVVRKVAEKMRAEAGG